MRRADRWLAVIRIVTGLWFAKGLLSKFTWTPFPAVSERWIAFLPERLNEYVQAGPPEWYREFLVGTAIPNIKLFAQLTAIGEVLVGLGLLLGFLTVLTSIGGLFLIGNYFFASLGMGFNQEGFHVLLITVLLAFIGARAGRTWGLDRGIVRRNPRSKAARLLA